MSESCKYCLGAVRIPIRQKVRECIEKGKEVIIVTSNKNGKVSEQAFKKCERPPWDMFHYCYKHNEVRSKDKKR